VTSPTATRPRKGANSAPAVQEVRVDHLNEISSALTAFRNGDFSVRLGRRDGLLGDVVDRINEIADMQERRTRELIRVSHVIGREGRMTERLSELNDKGDWATSATAVNSMIDDLVRPTTEVARVIEAVAEGDLSQHMALEIAGQPVKGEFERIGTTVNRMVDQLSSFADEVTRVAREVGTEGKLGGQAQVRGVSGVWRDLTDNVNSMAANLTTQVRNIAQVTTAVAQGDLSQKITVDAQGEILELKSTVNTMVDQLSSFAAEVTRVAREVGTEGRLGGQAEVAGVSGTWRDLTENVNQLAGNLTTQVRAIAEVSTAVTRGDLTRSIAVEAQGEVAELKDNINQMIANLRDTTDKNAQTDWLRSNLARIGGRMQGQRDLQALCAMLMSEITSVVQAQQGAFFLLAQDEGEPYLRLTSAYGYSGEESLFKLGEGLVGQSAVEKSRLRVDGAPANYLTIKGGLGEAPPADIVVLPVLFEEQVLGVIEIASFLPYSEQHLIFLDQLVSTIGVVLNTIIANTRTEELLAQSQRLTQELQVQSDELQRTNAELQEKAQLLTEQSQDLEAKNREIELARLGLEEKALQLELASQYKSEFLANMSHELRTPLNSLLILAKLLSDNPDSNLTEKQIEFARTIHRAGSDLLELINDILDLSKVEAGKMDVLTTALEVRSLCDAVQQTFQPVSEQKGLAFVVNVEADTPSTITTDEQRIRQVLRNLLSNAFKFTDTGRITLTVSVADPTMRFGVSTLDDAGSPVIAFAVTDTGIGVAADKLRHIFEAFQQADGTTSRRYGGTGLGLSISREIARLLGGAITVESQEGAGSTFTLYIPQEFPFADALPILPMQSPQEDHSPIGRGPIISATRPLDDAPPTDYDATSLAGASVLVVDDDVRNVFALTSALEMHGATVLYADNGAEGLRLLEDHPEIDLVLMDVMMPEMDGNQTTTAIRLMPGREQLPVLFLTAKAMPGDREKSLTAGASDYITKPVDLDRLLQSMRQWLAQIDGASAETAEKS
jgi:signal transduction histidine kinase/CheY-like chemotaxis protein/HAMP domain-containing protein